MTAKALVLMATIAAGAAPSARAGDIEGIVRFVGTPAVTAPQPVTKDGAACGKEVPDESFQVAGGRLANVVVIVKGAPPSPPGRAVLDQQGCRFVPHVQAVPAGSTLEIVNGDEVLHNIHGWLGRMTRFNVPTPVKGARIPVKLDRTGVIAVRCDVHGWMSAWIAVADGPAAVAGPDGAFAIRGVPAGKYTVTAWQERLGEKTAEITVPATGTARLELTFER
jgi:hypothetical protein